jgi:hypothetical protein
MLPRMASYAERLRIKADEIREKARVATDPDIRRHYAVLAEDYDRLALNIDRTSKTDAEAPAWRKSR